MKVKSNEVSFCIYMNRLHCWHGVHFKDSNHEWHNNDCQGHIKKRFLHISSEWGNEKQVGTPSHNRGNFYSRISVW